LLIHSSNPTDAGRIDNRLVTVLAAVTVVGLALRALLTLVTEFVIGINGPYYLVQVRAILRTGTLGLPDLPLLFYAQAAIAAALSLVLDSSDAVVVAVRSTDVVVPVALTVPAYLFVREFSGSRKDDGRPLLGMAIVGLIAVASGNSLRMMGSMIKNAAALPFCLLYVYYLYRSLKRPQRNSVILAAVFFAVSSLTHIGALALNVSIAGFMVLLGLGSKPTRETAVRIGVALTVCVVVAVVFLRLVDPDRGARLLDVILHPGRLFTGSVIALWLQGLPNPMMAQAVTSEEIWLGNALGTAGLFAVWRYRTQLDSPTRLLLGACSITALAFASPLLSPEWSDRLALMAFVPGLVPVAYLLCRHARMRVVLGTITVLVMLNGALAIAVYARIGLDPAAHEELEAMKTTLPEGRTIVIARHGLEWWVAWTMDTHIANRVGPALDARDQYDALLVVDEINPGAFGGPDFPLPQAAPPGAGPSAPPAGPDQLPDARRPSRVEPGWSLPDAGRLRSMQVTTLFEGEFFRLSLISDREVQPVRGR